MGVGVLVPVGNDTSDADEGAVPGRIVGTYLQGPVLAGNPELAAAPRWATGTVLSPLPMDVEVRLRAERLRAHAGFAAAVTPVARPWSTA